MAKLPDASTGTPLEIKERLVLFSLYPTVKGARRCALQSRVFATNPWGIIRQSIEEHCAAQSKRQALAFVEQAEDFYRSSVVSSIVATRPLLTYYCFLNLAKAYVLQSGCRDRYGAAYHGLEEKVRSNGKEFYDSYLVAHATTDPTKPNIFDDFVRALTGKGLGSQTKEYDLGHLRAQLLQGHRIWAAAAKTNERFIEIYKPRFMCNRDKKCVWLQIELFADDLSRFEISRRRLLNESGLNSEFREVKSIDKVDGRRILRFEQLHAVSYTDRASDNLKELVDTVRHKVWATIMKVPPYRKYYLYLCPAAEQSSLLPQVLSIWGMFYYLGSVTRYRPDYFHEILEGRFGGHVEEIVSNLPQQFVFYMASEFAKREVAQAPLV